MTHADLWISQKAVTLLSGLRAMEATTVPSLRKLNITRVPHQSGHG